MSLIVSREDAAGGRLRRKRGSRRLHLSTMTVLDVICTRSEAYGTDICIWRACYARKYASANTRIRRRSQSESDCIPVEAEDMRFIAAVEDNCRDRLFKTPVGLRFTGRSDIRQLPLSEERQRGRERKIDGRWIEAELSSQAFAACCGCYIVAEKRK